VRAGEEGVWLILFLGRKAGAEGLRAEETRCWRLEGVFGDVEGGFEWRFVGL